MKKIAILSSLAVALMMSAGVSMAANDGYLTETGGSIVHNGYSQCWHTGYWTPAMAVSECDGGVAPAAAKKAEDVPSGPAAPAMKITLQAETLFDFDKAVLRDDGKAVLDQEVASKMKDHPELEVVMITGYADRIGSEKYNQKLSEKRADAVKNYLIAQGIAANRLEAQGKGEADPKVSCDDVKGKATRHNKKLVECLQPNRRVDIRVKVQN